LSAADAAGWLRQRSYPELELARLAQTEGQFGVILTLSVRVQPLPRMQATYFEFGTEADAVSFARWVAQQASKHGGAPANLKYLSAAHVAGVRRLRGDSKRRAKPAVYLDFESEAEAKRFESALRTSKWKPFRDDVEAQRWFADRFRPQQTKRLGPGYLAAEILMPAEHLTEFLGAAVKLAGRVGVHLETEAYFLRDGRVLVLPGYLTRGPRRGFTWELLLAPMLLDLAMARYGGQPYVLGRWQSPYFRHKHAKAQRKSLVTMKRRTDPDRILNPGVFFGPVFRIGGVQGVFRTTFPGTVRWLRGLYGAPLTAAIFRALIGAHHDDDTAAPSWRTAAAGQQSADADAVAMAATLEQASLATFAAAARGCVNCGECNSVCPVFDDAKIRLPQMLTHIGERARDGVALGGTEQLLLDLCMRCGNCQEVCQADIPHLPLYAALEKQAGPLDEPRRERHVAVLAHLRHAERYGRDFLGLRPGGYLQRTPASLPGEVRFVLFRAENDAGPTDTCIHCGACVPVCPTSANLEFQEPGDARRITTDLNRCIGCGTCVEVCPANQVNGGRTLRVMEAPRREFFEVFAEFETRAGGK
jgi:ferredoxin